MNALNSTSLHPISLDQQNNPETCQKTDTEVLKEFLLKELQEQTGAPSSNTLKVVNRIVIEVERICQLSWRIQSSGQIRSWQQTLAKQRLNKCLDYHKLGSQRGRVELHSRLSVMVYRHVATPQSNLKFSGRYNLIEDFLQEFYADALKTFRRENQLDTSYTPRTRMELAEYMAFTEQYAKRSINLRRFGNQQLIILRAKSFARRLPAETSLDIEQAVEFSKGEATQEQSYSGALQQVRARLVDQAVDPHDALLRDRIIQELLQYLEEKGYSDCADYLVLRLQDLSAPEIEEIMNLTPKKRDYLQQRFKYHMEKFAHSSHWQLVHQWLGADLDQKLGMSYQQWELFDSKLESLQKKLLQLKQANQSDQQIAKALNITPKKVQKLWSQVLELASKTRNSEVVPAKGKEETKSAKEKTPASTLSVAA